MALPVTITGIHTTVNRAGPYKGSNGNYYFIGRDGTTATTLNCFKATDPTNAWSSVATQTGYTTAILEIRGYQVADVIHLAIIDGTDSAHTNYKYATFNMATGTEAFVLAETVHASIDPMDSTSTRRQTCDVIYRTSDNQPVVVYNGPSEKITSTWYSRVWCKVRTGAATWTAAIALDAGGAVDYCNIKCAYGTSNYVHCIWGNVASTAFYQRSLKTDNSLETASTAVTGLTATVLPMNAFYDSANNTVCVASYNGGNCWVNFTSAATPTINVDLQTNVSAFAGRCFGYLDAGTTPTTVWQLCNRTSTTLGVTSATDDGVTSTSFATPTTAFTGTTPTINNVGRIYVQGANYVLPYLVLDSTTLKYNEYAVRSAATAHAGAALLAGAGGLTATGRQIQTNVSALFAGLGGLTVTGRQIQTNVSALFAGVGAVTINGVQRHMPAALLAGAGGLTALVVQLNRPSALLAGAGGLTVTARQIQTNISALLAGTGGLTATITQINTPSALFAGAGGLTALANRWEQAAALFAGVGGLTAAPDPPSSAATLWQAEALFAGVSSLEARGIQHHAGPTTAAKFAGAGGLTVIANQWMLAQGLFAGIGGLTATGRQIQTNVSALFAGTGGLTALAIQRMQALATVTGVGGVTATANQIEQAKALFAGSGGLTATITQINVPAALFAGSGGLTALANQLEQAAALFAGVSGLTGDATLPGRIDAAALFAGAGGFSARANLIEQAAALFAAAGGFTTEARQIMQARAAFAGVGRLTATATGGLPLPLKGGDWLIIARRRRRR